jgi:hypothetical protein
VRTTAAGSASSSVMSVLDACPVTIRGGDDDDRSDAGQIAEAPNDVERAWVTPLEVLEAQDDRTVVGRLHRERCDRLDRAEPRRLGGAVAVLEGGFAFRQSTQDRSWFAGDDDGRRPKEAAESRERRALVQGVASGVEPRDVRVACMPSQFGEEPSLADPRLADHDDRSSFPGLHVVDHAPKLSELVGASDERTSRSTSASLLPSATAPSTTSRFPFSSNRVVGPHSMLSPSWRLVSGPTSTVPIFAAA